jgi:hypothetical protein
MHALLSISCRRKVECVSIGFSASFAAAKPHHIAGERSQYSKSRWVRALVLTLAFPLFFRQPLARCLQVRQVLSIHLDTTLWTTLRTTTSSREDAPKAAAWGLLDMDPTALFMDS